VKQLDGDPAQAWRVERDDKYYSRDRDTGHLVCVADYTADGFAESLRQSRERLEAAGSSTAAAAVEELRVHDVESAEKFAMITDPETGGVASLAALKRKAASVSGRDGIRLRRIGLGMNDPAHILRMLKRFPGAFDSVLMAGAWNVMELGGYEVLRYCEAHGVEVHIAGVFGAGLLWGGDRYRYANAAAAHLDRRDRILALCKKHGISLPWLAVHFATRPRCVTRLVFGCRTVPELKQCSRLLAVREPKAKVEALYAELEAEGLLPRWTFATTATAKL
jgi:D-threo-aldose 1-dehydrogenase